MADATVRTGVGAATIRIPREVHVRLELQRGRGTVSVGDGFARDGDAYLAPGTAAGARIELRVEGGVGAIDVERIP